MPDTSITRPKVPWAESPWVSGIPSPYYKKPSYAKLREFVRAWAEEHIGTDVGLELDQKGIAGPELFQQFAKDGFLIPFALGTHVSRRMYDMAGGLKLPGGVEPEDWDPWHDMIMVDELCRGGSNAPFMANYGGLAYGAGPIVHFGSHDMQQRFLPDLLAGKKRICLAITEPRAGSDVAGLGTTAELSSDGKHYIVNGEKKWITNGIYSDYFTTAVRTSGKAGEANGITFLVIPRGPGVKTRKMEIMGGSASGTTYVEFDDAKVPVENVIGNVGEGFKYIMYNFMHERMTIVYIANRLCRVCLADVVEYAQRRRAFGKPLMDQPVVRHKIGQMARQTEALTALMEATVYQMSQMSTEQANTLLGGQAALAKAQATATLEYVANESVMMFGGNGLTKGGAGGRVELIFREYKGLQIPGGAQDVMLDLAVRQTIKVFSKL